jgi:hypothetical protein
MSRYIADPSRAAVEGAAAKRRIQAWNFDRTVDGFLEARDAVASRHSSSPTAAKAARGSSLTGLRHD